MPTAAFGTGTESVLFLTSADNDVVAVDLPIADPRAGLEDYAKKVMAAIPRKHGDLTLVAQSLAGFIAPLVAHRTSVPRIVLLNAMVPRPGESAGQWWDNTGHGQARAYRRLGLELPAEFDLLDAFFHDVAAEVVAKAVARGEPATRFDTSFRQPWPLADWPKAPTRFLQAREDRFFPLEFQRRIVAERLGIEV